MQGGKRPTAAQQKWQDWQRDRQCCNCGEPASIHHCVGSTAKHNKQHIGQWFTLALCYDCHQGDRGIHHGMEAFATDQSRKEIEKEYFANDAFEWFHYDCGTMPMPLEAYEAIIDYHK